MLQQKKVVGMGEMVYSPPVNAVSCAVLVETTGVSLLLAMTTESRGGSPQNLSLVPITGCISDENKSITSSIDLEKKASES